MIKNYLSVFAVGVGLSVSVNAQQVHHVNANALGVADGASWVNAYTDLQDALAAAQPQDQIWVAAGVYKPTATTDTTASFDIPDSVEVYGGFNGTELQIGQRDWETNLTILSGDIGVEQDSLDNVTNVVSIENGQSEATRVDGFIVEHGFGYNGQNSPREYNTGGGIRVHGASPVLANLIIRYNAAMYGGGLSIRSNSYPHVSNVELHHNFAKWGSGVWVGDISKSTEKTVLLEEINSHDQLSQGAYFKDAYSYNLKNSQFRNNSVGVELYRPNGGDISKVLVANNGRGFYVRISSMPSNGESVLFKQVIAANNTTDQLLYNSSSDANGSIKVYNSTFYGMNSLSVSVRDSSKAQFWNCIVEGTKNISEEDGTNDSPLFYNSVFDEILTLEGDSNVFDATDNFEDPENGNFNIRNTSQAINAGTLSVLPLIDLEDINGNERKQSTSIDAGAVESSYTMVAVGFADENQIDVVDVFPSPFATSCTVNSIAGEFVNVSVFDTQGKLVESYQGIQNVEVLANSKQGVFVIQVSNDNGINSYKVIKE